MPTYDATTAECLVYTYKEGLLSVSKRSHDLKLRVNRFSVTIEDDAIEATFDPKSFEVVCSMNSGREDPDALSDRDKRQVIENIHKDVLHPDRFKEIRFRSTEVARDDDAWDIEGRLWLHGIERTIELRAAPEGDFVVARARIHQPDYRITPFSAMLGALKIKPDLDVELRIPLPLD